MKTFKFLVAVALVAVLFSCEKESNSSNEYRIEISSTVDGRLVVNTPHTQEINVGKGHSILVFERTSEQEVSFVLHLNEKGEKGAVTMTLHVDSKMSTISNESGSDLLGIEGVY